MGKQGKMGKTSTMTGDGSTYDDKTDTQDVRLRNMVAAKAIADIAHQSGPKGYGQDGDRLPRRRRRDERRCNHSEADPGAIPSSTHARGAVASSGYGGW